MSTPSIKSQILKLAPVFAFLVYGLWAYIINSYAQSESSFQSGIIQGSYAFIATLFLRWMTIKIHSYLQHKNHAKLLTFAIGFIIITGIPAGFHCIFKTTEILYSILPGAIMGGIYLFVIITVEIKTTKIN